MTIEPSTLTIAGFVGTWIMIAFVVGGVWGRMTAGIKINSKEIIDIQVEIAAINKKFTTEQGEPVLLSYKAHDHICTRTNELLTQSLQHVTTAFETHSKHVSSALEAHSQAVKSCGEQVANLTVAVAVIEDRFENENKTGKDARG